MKYGLHILWKMPSKSKLAGKNFEYRILRKFKKAGLQAKRIPLSGSGSIKGDLEVESGIFELKYNLKGVSRIYQYLNGFDALIFKGKDEDDVLIVLNLEDILGGATWLKKLINRLEKRL